MTDKAEYDYPLTETPRFKVAYLLWQANEGYISAEDRAVGHNWMLGDPRDMHEDDAQALPGWLDMADAVLAAIDADILRRQDVALNPDNPKQVDRLWNAYENVAERYAQGPDGMAQALRDLRNPTEVSDWPRRDAAVTALAARGEPERHLADIQARANHGHPGVCCCWTQRCWSDLCNVNAQIVANLSTPPAEGSDR